VGEVQSVSSTVGWWYTTPSMEAARTEPPPGGTLSPLRDSYLLTGDGSIVHARATLRYRIAEPGLRYIFELQNAATLVQNAVDNALNYAAVHSDVEITRDSTAFRETAARRLDQLIAEQKLQITVDQLTVEVRPPRQLQADFERVIEAEIRKSAALSDARKHETETINQARATTNALINTAQPSARPWSNRWRPRPNGLPTFCPNTGETRRCHGTVPRPGPRNHLHQCHRQNHVAGTA